MLVCDRCGAPEDTCHHRHDSDYCVEPKELYEGTIWLIRWLMVILVCLIGLIAWRVLA